MTLSKPIRADEDLTLGPPVDRYSSLASCLRLKNSFLSLDLTLKQSATHDPNSGIGFRTRGLAGLDALLGKRNKIGQLGITFRKGSIIGPVESSRHVGY